MIRRLLLGVVVIAGCDKAKPAPPPPTPPVGSGALADLPDPLSLDWRSLRYDLGSLGSVTASAGRAEFKLTEDDTGAIHASQEASAVADSTGFLDLDAPALVDLDGDRHEEAVIPFELHSAHDSVFGAFVFTLRDGNPVQLGTITTTKKPGFTIEGSAIKTAEGVVWRWDAATRRLVQAR